ncbi:cell wall hydrolase [Scopulibacillus cellulosilyticus]|uniref:Cell wall hydrolase n=1 Tax=Scopulibacillus cellulosilyticus TaxID=2665665 RepID=A0ABW2PYK5_9BACL
MKKLLSTLIVAAAVLVPAAQSFAYTVQPGDNLSKIAINNHTTVQSLLNLNPQISNENDIYAGSNINISSAANVSGTSNSSNVSSTASTSYDRELLAKLVHAEAGGESFAGKVAVAAVVLNRVDSPAFPNTIQDVIYQPGQFTPVQNGMINNTPDQADYQAVDQAFANRGHVTSSLYFYNPSIATDHWLDHLPTTEVIGHHVFKQ